MANEAPVILRLSIRIILFTSVAVFECSLWKRDIVQAYMQAHKSARIIFTPPPKEGNLLQDVFLKVLNSHQRMVDSGSMWYETYQPV